VLQEEGYGRLDLWWFEWVLGVGGGGQVA
jgi:hypothetical protein